MEEKEEEEDEGRCRKKGIYRKTNVSISYMAMVLGSIQQLDDPPRRVAIPLHAGLVNCTLLQDSDNALFVHHVQGATFMGVGAWRCECATEIFVVMSEFMLNKLVISNLKVFC